MKKIILYSLLVGSMAFSACEDMLEKEPIHQLSASEFFTTENDLEIYSNSFYEYGLPSANEIARGDGMSDYAAINSPSTFLSGSWSSIDQSGWGVGSWSALRNINYFLEGAPNADVSETVLNHYLGLARYWRAVFYLEKVQTFGDVPWYETALQPNDPELNKARDSREFVMGKVLEDINFAAEHIWPTKDTYSSTVNQYTALAMKSRICLYEGTFRKYHTEFGLSDADTWLRAAADAAKKVMDSGKYELVNTGSPESDYRSLFVAEDVSGMTRISKEVILARLMNTDSRVWHDLTWNFNSPTNGSRWSLVKQFVNTYLMLDGKPFTDKADYDEIEFLSEMKNRDHRLSQTIRTEGYKREDGSVAPPDFAVTLTGYHILKWSLDDSWHDGQGQCTNNIPVIRYAEVLLNYAEAKAELGEFGTAEWAQTIKPLRERAGVVSTEPAEADAYLQTTLFPETMDKYLLEIRRERGIELCFEGLRYNDLMRWKRGDLLSSEEMAWKGIYIPAKDVNYDLNGDGKPDVCVVDVTPKPTTPGVKYVVLGANIRLSEGDKGHLEWAWGVERKWEDKKYLRPIPQSAVTLNPNLLPQNDGWE
ncbi:RagB/SusD family nutrient uptake outer membrane protein [Sunxiuqinia elliptica]|uniref:Putative outer membrane starch-binding protein n=1 Tax=Sunxiuqinia elliptica TaxID=655355 RepID=A0A4R6HC22_9BACT|nr:RagB/SusD family nutrient uptake outer membrane protein [Sunxiuqinia elliptica]TDO05567.1 putative outer membrane starch-binding protein [Sunxiuqinia elliptica]TDO65111.1 putative outer membrane starch-binding protein [Sunxiuqinia elliptica]